MHSNAQTIIGGYIHDKDNGKPIEGVIIQCINDNKTIAYTISNKDGLYELKTNLIALKLNIIYIHISYKKQSKTVANKSQKINLKLQNKILSINEVTVYAPKLRQRGDTLSYRLSAFKGVADVTLEDAMKNLPGVTIKKSGAIQYLGKDISHFYIEGLDLLGGKYGIATKNIRADMVSNLEFIENHQPVKMLEERSISNNVAINVKLNEKTKMLPTGSVEAGVGYGEEGILYRLGLTGMLFSPKFQTLNVIKYGNIGEASSTEAVSHTKEYPTSDNLALTLLGKISAGSPPLENSRYNSITGGLVSINSINKLSENEVLKINVDYSYNKNSYSYKTESNYYIGGLEDIVIEEISPLSEIHNPAMSIHYDLNDKGMYIQNRLWATASFIKEKYPIINSSNKIGQTREAITYDVNNKFSYRKLIGNNLLSISSQLSYIATPENAISFSSSQQTDENTIQNADGRTFFMDNSINFSFKIGNYTTIFTPLFLRLSHDKVTSRLIGTQEVYVNNLKGLNVEPAFVPRLEYISPNNSMTVKFMFPIRYSMLSYNSKDYYYNKFTTNPNIDVNYTLSPSAKFKFRAGFGNEIGDITDFLISPIQTSYRSVSIKSGILAENLKGYSILGYEFKKPLSYLFLNAEVGYNYKKTNLLNSQIINEENIISSSVLKDNRNHSLSSRLSVTKLFQTIGTKLNVGGTYSWSQGDILQHDVFTKYNHQTYGADGSVVSRPWKWIELDYSVNIGWNKSSFSDIKQTLMYQTHLAKLSFFPIQNLNIFSRVEYVNNEVAPSKKVSLALIDIGISYKFKKIQLELSLNNILNTKKYAYTVFNGLDSFSYNYRLRGREIMLSIKLY